MKKIISIFLSIFVLCSCITGLSVSANAQTDDSILDKLEYTILEDGTIKITNYDSLEPEYELPDTIDGKTVTVIGKKAFYSCHALSKITLPDSITTIENQAFKSCGKLSTVVLGNSVKSIGYQAFADCKVLKSINFPQSLETIGKNSFSRCFALNNITIPQSVKTIGNSAFSDCTGLINLTFENGEFIIDEYAFGWCLKLSEVTLHDKVKEIKNYAFYACDRVTDFTIESKDCVIYDSIDTLPEKATIHAYESSTAHNYAVKYDKKFVALEIPDDILLGDVDCDNNISILDATQIQRYLASQITLDDKAMKNANVDNDNDISVLDATQIQRFVAQIIESF